MDNVDKFVISVNDEGEFSGTYRLHNDPADAECTYVLTDEDIDMFRQRAIDGASLYNTTIPA